MDAIAKQSTDLRKIYQNQRRVYCEMFSFLIEEGKDKTVALKGMLHCDLQLAALTGLKTNGLVIGAPNCPESNEIDRKEFPLEELLQSSILPYSKCTRENGCVCVYGFTHFRDKNGSLIKKNY